jgi:hypothetical protein
VIHTTGIVLLGQCIQEAGMDWVSDWNEGDEKCVRNFGAETSWKAAAGKL